MNNLIDKSDPRIKDLIKRLKRASLMLDKLEVPSRRSFNGQRFMTDSELSERLRISRRTLQQYRSSGLIPYYLICGKVIYMESEIQKFLEDARRRSIDEHTLV